MCVAMPAQVLSIDGDTAVVSISGNKINANISLINAKVGDYVLVHAGCALQILDEQEAADLAELFAEIESAAYAE